MSLNRARVYNSDTDAQLVLVTSCPSLPVSAGRASG